MIGAFLSRYWAQKLGWTLLHFLWQGTVIAIVYAILRRALRPILSPQARYALACLALAMMTIAPLLTFLLLPGAGEQMPVIPWNISPALWQQCLPGFVVVWMIGEIVFWIRLFGGWRFTAHLKAASYPASADWQRLLDGIAQRVKTSQPVRLLLSSLVEVPTVIGWLRPVILLPASALMGLPADHVTALLAHELAHIRRHDYLANILQSAVEALLFYHPAVWWVSEQIRAERELCCDDLAVIASGSVLIYARALTHLESIQQPRLRFVQAANGGSLVNRIRRLIEPSRPLAESLPGAGAAWAMTVLLLAGVGAATVRARQTSVPVSLAVEHSLPDIPAAITVPAKAASIRVASQVTHVAGRALDTLLFDPFLPAEKKEAPQSNSVFVDVVPKSDTPGIEATEVHNTARVPVATSPVLLARAELPPPNRQPIPTLHAESRMVQIEVSVRDSRGQALAGLSKQDFALTEDGKPRAIDIFSDDAIRRTTLNTPATMAAASPLPTVFSNRNPTPPFAGHSTAILLDHSTGDWEGVRWSRQSVQDLIDKGLPDERIALYVVGPRDGLILAQDYTTDRELLLRTLRDYVPGHLKAPPQPPRTLAEAVGSSMGLPGFSLSPAALNQPPSSADPYTNTVRYVANSLARPDEEPYEDTVENVRASMHALARHLALVPGRKSIFWVSDGFRPREIAGRTWRENAAWQKTITALNEADVAVNVIDTIAERKRDEAQENRLVMQQIADETGGRMWSAQSQGALPEGIEASRKTYTLAFYLPESDRDNKFHSLQLRVNRPGLQLSYRQGYYAGMTDMPDPATEKARNGETLEAVLLNQVDSRGVGITALVDIADGKPHRTVDFSIKLDPGTLSLQAKNEGWTGRVEEMFVELNEEGRTLAKVTDVKNFEFADASRPAYAKDGITWHLSGPLAEGATKITLAVRDANSGHVGSLTVPLK